VPIQAQKRAIDRQLAGRSERPRSIEAELKRDQVLNPALRGNDLPDLARKIPEG